MEKSESPEEFYGHKFDGAAFRWMPDTIRNEIGHFNVFPLDPFVGDRAKPIPYKRRDFYKIMLVGNSNVHWRLISSPSMPRNAFRPCFWSC